MEPKAEASPNFLGNLGPDLFETSFMSAKQSKVIAQQVRERVDNLLKSKGVQMEPHFFLLPPLFVVSNDRFLLVRDDIILVASEEGSVVPVVELQTLKSRSILSDLITLYQLASPNFVDLDSLYAMLQPPVPEDLPFQGQC
jgi:hypothetical protein